MAKILVAEDDAFLSSLLVRDLLASNYEARAAYDGIQAVEEIRTWRPDLILLDLLMPLKDGFEVLEEVRANPDTKDMHFVVLSNLGERDSIERVKKFQVSDYMVKANTTPHEVVEKVKTLLV